MATLQDLEKASSVTELNELRGQLIGTYSIYDINNTYNSRRKYLLNHPRSVKEFEPVELPQPTPKTYFTIPIIGTSKYPNTIEYQQQKGFLI